jgi:hypothetical protein
VAIPLEALESRVLQLPTADRVRLLDRVVASLDADATRDAAWDAVAAAPRSRAGGRVGVVAQRCQVPAQALPIEPLE